MWVNKTLPAVQYTLFPTSKEKQCHQTLTKWALLNPHTEVHFWFDGMHASQEAIEQTRKLISQSSLPIILRDVRTLPIVGNHPAVFSDKVSIYFRADLLRTIAAVHCITKKQTACFVYADFDMEPLSEAQLFDQATLSNLKQFGFVLGEKGSDGYENGFQIITNKNPNVLEALNWTLIELNIERAYNALDGNFLTKQHLHDTLGPMQALQEVVYDSLPYMFAYLLHLDGIVTLRVKEELYNKRRHGLEPFGIDFLDTETLKFSRRTNREILLPTKQVNLPRSRFY